MFDKMLCLVGENPLPIYFGIDQLGADGSKIILVYSTGTKPHAEGIKNAVRRQQLKRTVVVEPQACLQDPHDPQVVSKHIDTVLAYYGLKPSTCGLNYTGGTKVMSAYGLRAWSAGIGNTFYLDEGSARFYFDNQGNFRLEPSKPLTIATLADLHGRTLAEPQAHVQHTVTDLKTLWDGRASILDGLRSLTSRAPKAQHTRIGEIYDRPNDSKEDVRAWREFVGLLEPTTQSTWQGFGSPPARFEDYRAGHSDCFQCRHDTCGVAKFVTGGWLEALVENVLLSLRRSGAPSSFGQIPDADDRLFDRKSQFASGQTFKIMTGKDTFQLFESDVLAVIKNRLIYVSVTTSSSPDRVKGKMFEGIYRARQIGGGLCRVCVVSLLEKSDLDNCMASAGSKGRHVFFGENDIQSWVDGDTTSLYRFVTAN